MKGYISLFKEKKVIFMIGLVCAAFNLVLSAMMIVGIPTIIKVNLELSDTLYSYAQVSIGAGSLLGGILMGALGKKFKIQSSYVLLLCSSLGLIPVAGVLMIDANKMIIYGVILVCCTVCIAVSTMFTIQALTYLQQITPRHLVGKVIAVVMALCTISQPIGQAVYGIAFEKFDNYPELVISVGILLATILSIASRSVFIHIEEKSSQLTGSEQIA